MYVKQFREALTIFIKGQHLVTKIYKKKHLLFCTSYTVNHKKTRHFIFDYNFG